MKTNTLETEPATVKARHTHTPAPWRYTALHDRSAILVTDESGDVIACLGTGKTISLRNGLDAAHIVRSVNERASIASAAATACEWLELLRQSHPEMTTLIRALAEMKLVIEKP